MASQISQNYAKDCEAAVNKQINMELYSSYVYISMGVSLIDKTVVVLLEHEREKEMPSSFYFDRDDVALHHFAKFFKHQSHVYAEKLMKFQNRRGGRIVLKDIQKPEQDEWGNGLEGMQKALQLEKNINQSLLDLHKLAMDRNDPNLCDFLETYYLAEKVETIKEIGDHITNLKRLNVPENVMGEYLFEKYTLKKSD